MSARYRHTYQLPGLGTSSVYKAPFPYVNRTADPPTFDSAFIPEYPWAALPQAKRNPIRQKYLEMPRGAGGFYPQIFPYGQGGRPVNGPQVLGNPDMSDDSRPGPTERAIRKSTNRELFEYVDFCDRQIKRSINMNMEGLEQMWHFNKSVALDEIQKRGITPESIVRRPKKQKVAAEDVEVVEKPARASRKPRAKSNPDLRSWTTQELVAAHNPITTAELQRRGRDSRGVKIRGR